MTRTETRRSNYHQSLKRHQISGKGLVHIGLPVILLSSANPYLVPGVRGVLVINEQGTDLNVINATFRQLNETEHTLGAPVDCRSPIFVYSPFDHRSAEER